MTKSVQETVTALQQFITSGTDEAYKTFALDALQESTTFEPRFLSRSLLLPGEEQVLNTWFFSAEGKKDISQLMEASVRLINGVPIQTPGHDLRHFLKALYAGLRFIQEDSITDFRQCFLLAAFLHDLGRLVESKMSVVFPGNPLQINHAQLSTALARQLFVPFNTIPQLLKEHILYALLNHTEGTGKPFFAQAVQRCDREQLVGPEGIERVIGCDGGVTGLQLNALSDEKFRYSLPSPGSPEDKDVMHHIEFYMRNLYPNIGSKGEQNAEELKVVSGIFLSLAVTDEIRAQIFAPEIAREEGKMIDHGENKQILSQQTWELIRKGLDEETKKELEEYEGKSIEELLEFLLRLPYAAVTDSQFRTLRSRMIELSDEEKKRFCKGLAYAIVMRKKTDEEEKRFLEGYPKDILGGQFIRLIEFYLKI
jgi:hypothetical protein